MEDRIKFAAIGACALIGGAYVMFSTSGPTVMVCNASPFQVGYVAIATASQGDDAGKSRVVGAPLKKRDDKAVNTYLAAGQCDEIEGVTFKDGDVRVSADTARTGRSERELVKYVYGLKSPEDLYWEDPRFTACVPKAARLGLRVKRSKTCNGGHLAGFSSIKLRDAVDDTVVHLISAPSLPLVDPRKFKKVEALRKEIRRAASSLRTVVVRHQRFAARYPGHIMPYHLGAKLEDHNGALSSGIVLRKPARLTIFGDAMPLRDGDILYRINDHDVFSPIDVHDALLAHGGSRKLGVSKALKLVVGRRGNFYTINTTLFFNERHPSFAGERKGDAVYYGFMDAASLGLAAEANCASRQLPSLAQDTLRGVQALLYGLADAASDKPARRDRKYIPAANYEDFGACVWRAEQEIALAQQKHKKDFQNAAWITVFTPSAPRLLLQKGASTAVKTKARKTALASIASTVGFELVETGLFFLNDQSPLQGPADVARDFYYAMPYVAGISASIAVVGRTLR